MEDGILSRMQHFDPEHIEHSIVFERTCPISITSSSDIWNPSIVDRNRGYFSVEIRS